MRTKSLPASIVSVLLCLVQLPAGASADEPLGVELMRPDSLIGWDHGNPPPQGWIIADGRLGGDSNSTPLLSGYSAGAFEVRFRWSVADGGAWKVRLPEVPDGPGLELVLREGDGCGRLTDGDQELAPGGLIEPLPQPEEMHAATIRRTRDKLSLTVDDRQLFEVDVRGDRRFGLGLAVVDGRGSLAELRGAEPPGEPMFGGQDFAGWWTPGDLGKWTIEDGEIVRRQRAGDYLRTEKEYGNFTLSLQYQMRKGGNSGLGIRTPRQGWPSSDGMELQWLDAGRGLGQHDHLSIYGNVPPLVPPPEDTQQWNWLLVKADGSMISAWENGQLAMQHNTFDHPELKHRPVSGWIGFQDHGAWIRLRDVRLLEAPPGRGLEAWYRPVPRRATAAVVDRLMNPETLAAADGIRSGTVWATASGNEGQQCVLAELTGPGALVQIGRTGDDGRLALYFDGEEKPRIECPAGQLRECLPPLSENTNPVLTCLTYKTSLKIAAQDAKGAQYLIDYVTFPADCQLETFRDRQSGFPRGWLGAVHYHAQKLEGGARRQFDGLPLYDSEPRTFGPGQREELVHVEGAGVVQSLKLRSGRGTLQNNDLWLEVTIDGEASPAVAAPARFWLPGLVESGGYQNLVMTEQSGMMTTLAMPFAEGLTVAVRNSGGQSIEGVGVEISVRPATDQDRQAITGLMRLRGVFQPAQDGCSELIVQQGTGRWVGFIYEAPEAEPTGIGSLRIDDQSADGWTAENLDLFFGHGGDFRQNLSGRYQRLAWRYLWLAPMEFEKSLVLKANHPRMGDRLALFYMKK